MSLTLLQFNARAGRAIRALTVLSKFNTALVIVRFLSMAFFHKLSVILIHMATLL